MKITLCGSGRFWEDFNKLEVRLSQAGHTVYALGDHDKNYSGEVAEEDKWTKEILDLVHLDKISNSDAILVIRGYEYVGHSTKREIAWASMQGKKIYYEISEVSDIPYALVDEIMREPQPFDPNTDLDDEIPF